MFLQLAINHPEALPRVVSSTPAWVWGLLAALVSLGLSQTLARQMSLQRVTLTPVAMTVFSVYGIVSGFGKSPLFWPVLIVWLACWLLVVATTTSRAEPAGTRWDTATGKLFVPGSWLPLVMILGIFLTKYIVGVELAMAPQQAHEATFALTVAALYGVFSGVFAARGLALIKAIRRAPAAALAQATTA